MFRRHTYGGPRSVRPSFPTPGLTDVDRARLAIGFKRMEVETVQARAAAGIEAAVASLPTHRQQLAAMVREANLLEGIMSTVERRDQVVKSWRDKVGALSRELSQLKADAVKLPAAHVASETTRLLGEIRGADQQGRLQFREYLKEAATEAALLRAKAEAEGDQQRAVADELAAARMARSASSKGAAEDLVAHARRLVAAGQPLAARPYVLAIDQLEQKPMAAHALRAEYRVAMDSVDPILSQAAAVERTAADAEVSFEVERSRFLAEVGLGVDTYGEAGRGTGEQIAVAGIRAKHTAFAADPEHYSEPAPTGPRIDGSPDPKASPPVAPTPTPES